MKITSEFGLILAKRNENETNQNTGNIRFLKDNKSDTFVSTTKAYSSRVSFLGGTLSPNKLVDMLKSNNYFKILGATIVATATTLWTQLNEAGIKDKDITEKDITKMLTSSVDEALKEIANNKLCTEKTEISNVNEEIIEAEATPIAPAKKRGRPKGSKNKPKIKAENIKTVPLKDGKQKIQKIKRITEENIKLVSDLANTGKYSQIEIARQTGIPEGTVSRIVKKYDLPTPKKTRKANIDSLTNEKILQIFEENKNASKKEVAQIFGITPNDLDKLCKERKIPKFVSLKKAEQIDEATLRADILLGLTTQEIAQKEGLKTNEVRDAYKKYGIENPNRKKRILLDDEIITEIKQRKANGESKEEIAQAMNVAIITVNRVISNKNSSFFIELKKLAKEGLTIDEIAKATNKTVRTIKRFATRYNINIKGNSQESENTSSTNKIDILKKREKTELSKYLIKKYNIEITEDDIFFAFPRLEIEQTEEIKNLIKTLKERFEKEIEIINKLDYAQVLQNIEKTKKTDESSKPIRYSNEDLINRYLAKSYNLMLGRDNNIERVQNFIDKISVPKIILDNDKTDFINDLWRHKDTEIPENSPLFEEYKKCFNRKAIELKVESLKSNYKKAILDQISTPENLKILQDANSQYFEITPKVLFNLVLERKNCNYAKLIIPKLKTNKEDANDTQKELMEIISSFKKKEFVKEYIDLVNIYNQFCTENYAPDFAESFKKNLNKISLLENISVSELRDLINNYKSGVAIDSESIIDKTTEKIDYSALSFEELKNELEEIYNKLPQNTNEELYNRIYDFFISAKETDFDKLCEFMLIMDDFINNKITEKEVLNKCQEDAIKPMESCIDDWIMEQKCTELKLKINEKIQKIATYVKNDDQSSNNDSSLYSQIENYVNFLDSFSVEDLITFDKNFDKMLSELKDSENIKEIRYKFFNQLALITNNITTDNQLKNFALEIYNTNRNDISIEEAYNCLNKIDKYNSLQDDKKILIGSVLDIFNDETSSLEKKLLYEIIYNKCLEEDSVIKNEAYGVNVTITKELKQELMREYQNVFVLLKWFEEAAALKAKFKGSAGIKELGKKNKDPKYCMEIKITNKNYAQIRLYSTFATDKNGNIIKKDRYGNLIKNFVFTKLVHDHNKMEK